MTSNYLPEQAPVAYVGSVQIGHTISFNHRQSFVVHSYRAPHSSCLSDGDG